MKIFFIGILFLFNILIFASDFIIPRLSYIEELLYGQRRIGESIDSRISRIENILFGKSYKENNIETRLKRIENPFLTKKSGQLSLIQASNFLEWKLKKRISQLPLLTKISNLKRIILGEGTLNDPLLFEISKLKAVVLGNLSIESLFFKITDEVSVDVKLKKGLSSRYSRKGEIFELEVCGDIFINNLLIIPAGTLLYGRITYLKKAGLFGKNGRLKFSIESMMGMDEKLYPLELRELSFGNEESNNIAAGVSLLGLAAFGPVGMVGGFFIRGRNVSLPEGTHFNIKVLFLERLPVINSFIRKNKKK